MLIDDVTIKIKAGDGGRGAVAFDKNKMAIGPTGARGGNGGNVYFEGTSDLSALNRFRNKKDWDAGRGEDGRSQFRDGHTGTDLIIKVPVGTVMHNLDTGRDQEIISVNQRVLLAKGGLGGRGNFHFRSPRNTSPTQFEEGQTGDEFHIRLELKLIADIGLIGLPNVGKSSLLNELTRAQSKVGNYPFTTLEPHLGVYYGLILADIPGLIEGASAGKGLGVKFLRHIERTRILFHMISAESENPKADYKTIRAELKKYNPELIKKDEYVFISKSDAVTPEILAKHLKTLRTAKLKPLAISIHDFESIEKVKKLLNQLLEEKEKSALRDNA
jgi:GTP-binding protein